MVRAVGITEAVVVLVGGLTAVWWFIGASGRRVAQHKQARAARRYIRRHR